MDNDNQTPIAIEEDSPAALDARHVLPVQALCKDLLGMLRFLKGNDRTRGREWAIGATEAEKLLAWVNYVAAMPGWNVTK